MTNHCHALAITAFMALVESAFGASLEGTYNGERVLTHGDPAACAPKDAVSVTIQGDLLTFTNARTKSYTISFSPQPDGSFVQLSADVGGRLLT